jgi:cell division protein ZapA
MSAKQNSLDVTIMGRAYKFACEESEREDLLAAAGFLDQKMNEIKSAGKVASAERIAVMAALNIANEMLMTSKGKSTHVDLDGYRRRIASMRALLDQALEPQEKLL